MSKLSITSMSDEKKSNGLENPAFQASEINDYNEPIQNGKNSVQQSNGQIIEKDEDERPTWGNSIEFLMSCISMSVGLGNIWRFPFTAYENGGGAFLIPYIIVLTVIGRPLYYMEMAMGQFSNRGNAELFRKLSPYLTGIGYGQVFGCACVATYYSTLMAISLFYLGNSFTSVLPWSMCLPEYAEYEALHDKVCKESSGVNTIIAHNSISSAELFFTQEVLKEKTDISDGIGYPEWRLTLCLLACWFLAFLVTMRGVRSSGKAAYFLAIFPYVIMIALLIRAVTLDGASDGMYKFIETDWSKLAEPDVWYAAVTQCFFSLNVTFGTILMFSSFNKFEHNIRRDALIVTTLDTFTSLLSGVTMFGILGNLAYNLNVPVEEVLNSGGVGLAFISYPDAIAKFEAVPWLFSILFFFMLVVLGLGSLVSLQGAFNSVVRDLFPNLIHWKVSTITSIGGFFISLIYVTPGGQFMVNLIDYFGGNFLIFTLSLIEVSAVSWLYGIENLCIDIEFMMKSKVNVYWRITWTIITPVLLIVIFIYSLVKFERLTYAGRDYPDDILAFGWVVYAVGVSFFFLWILIYVIKNRGKNLKYMFSTENWGPKHKKQIEEWTKFREEVKNEKRKDNRSWIRRKINFLFGF